jgi:oxidase EvaA
MLSEEGGRFYKNQNRNIIVEVSEDFDMDVPKNYKWLTLNQLMKFMEYNNNVNIEARSLLSVLTF